MRLPPLLPLGRSPGVVQRRQMGRALAILYLSAPTVALVSILVPHWSELNEPFMGAIIIAAYTVGAFLLYQPEAPSLVAIHALLGCVTMLIGAAILVGGGGAASTAYGMFYVWVMLFAFVYLSPVDAALQLGLVALVHAMVLGELPSSSTRPGEWIVILITSVTTGAVVGRLVQRSQAHSLRDELTGLPSRRLLCERLEEAIGVAQRHSRHLTVMLLDLDHFKEVNDTLGHGAGDALLVEVAKRLRDALRKSDVIARFGGDEFAVLLTDVKAPPDARVVADRVLSQLTQPVVLGDATVDIDASIGIAMYPEHGEDPTTLISRADIAMYAAKASKAGWRVYDPGDDVHSRERLELTTEMKRAFGAGELAVHYQPIVAAAGGPVRLVEALVRWEHPRLGLLGPDRFLALAERTGSMRRLTHTVLAESLRQCREWDEAGAPIEVAVNVSARDLDDRSLPDEVEGLLRAAGVAPSRLWLEITERWAVGDLHRATEQLARLRRLGVRIALDDFGTGYSSLAHLDQLPLDAVKIDRSLVSRAAADLGAAAIVTAAASLSRALGLEVVAEGVETEATRAVVVEAGCGYLQGYLFARPMPGAELASRWEVAEPARAAVLAPSPPSPEPSSPSLEPVLAPSLAPVLPPAFEPVPGTVPAPALFVPPLPPPAGPIV